MAPDRVRTTIFVAEETTNPKRSLTDLQDGFGCRNFEVVDANRVADARELDKVFRIQQLDVLRESGTDQSAKLVD